MQGTILLWEFDYPVSKGRTPIGGSDIRQNGEWSRSLRVYPRVLAKSSRKRVIDNVFTGSYSEQAKGTRSVIISIMMVPVSINCLPRSRTPKNMINTSHLFRRSVKQRISTIPQTGIRRRVQSTPIVRVIRYENVLKSSIWESWSFVSRCHTTSGAKDARTISEPVSGMTRRKVDPKQ